MKECTGLQGLQKSAQCSTEKCWSKGAWETRKEELIRS